jgi:flagellar biosynthetic protein FlhB
VALAWSTPGASAARAWAVGSRILWQAGFALLAIGALDYGIQRWRLLSSLKMTRQEVRDELRHSEANPEVKARVRRIQMDMVRRRMLQAVPRATVVVTNPTHFAVALEYRREKGSAPVVVAKGRDLIAGRIRDIAREHSVPIIENPPLARALYKECEVGETIPGALFGAVAEVLAYLIRIRQLVL